MSNIKIIGQTLPNIPWSNRPEEFYGPVWRYKKDNPIIPRDILENSNSIFNSAVIPYKGAFAGVFRVDNRAREMRLHTGFSENGFDWRLEPEPIDIVTKIDEMKNSEYGYDPRLTKIDDKYYVTWCNGYHGPTIGVAWTDDFREYHQLENAFLPYNRNGVLFPKLIKGKYAILSRPSDIGHTAFGDIFYSESPDLVYWGRHRHVMSPVNNSWQSTKIGAGPVPIETTEGWLLIYHGVLTSCNGFVYSMGAALLDLEEPWKVIKRTKNYILSPQKYYECVGDVPNVVFPTAALADPDTGRIAIYYGSADTSTSIAFTTIQELISEMDKNPLTI